MMQSRWFRRTLIVLALVAAGAAAFYLFLQSDPGRSLTAALIERSLSSDDMIVDIEGLSGTIPGAPEVAKLTVRDREGPWLVLHDVRLVWSPLALIGGDFVADDVSIARLDWLRLPGSGEKPAEGGDAIPSLAIHKLSIAAATIAPAVAGVGGTFALEGAADTRNTAERAALKLNLRELRSGGARATIDAHYEPEQSRLDLNGRINDRAGGTLATMLELPPDAPLAVALDSQGSLDDWRARLTATGGSALNATGEATIVREGEWRRLNLAFASDIAAIGPERWRRLYQGHSNVEIEGAKSDADALRVDRLAATTPALTLTATGIYDPAAKRAGGEAKLTASDGAPLAPMIGGVTDWRDLTLTAKLEGPWPSPALVVDARAAEASVEGSRASALTARLEATPDGQWDDEGARIALAVRAEANELIAEDETLHAVLGPSARASLQAALIDRRRLSGIMGELVTPGATLRFAGDADARAMHGVISLEAADLARAGLEGGALSLNATIEANLDSAQWSAEGRGTARNVTLDSALGPLFQGTQDLRFALAGGSGQVALSSLTIESAQLSLIASGTASADALNLDARATVANLNVIAPEHEGRAVADLRIAGTAQAPRVSGTVALPIGRLFGRRVEDLSLAIAESDARGFARLTLNGEYDNKPVKGAAGVAWRAEGGARLDDLSFALASINLQGDAVVDGDGLISGVLQTEIGEVADLAPFVDEDIAGTVAGTLRFEAARAQQIVALALEGPSFTLDTAHFAEVTARGTIRDLFGATLFDVRASAVLGDFDGFVLEDLEASGRGPLRALVVEGRAAREGTRARGRATLKLSDRPLVVSIATLDLARDDKTARLVSPVDITIRDGRVVIPAARIAAGGGSVVVSGDAGAATDLAVAANAIPLWVAAFATEPLPVVGTATGTARVREAGATSFDVKVVNLAPEADPRLVRNMTLTARGQTDRTGVNFDLTLADAARTSFRANGRIPFAESGPLTIDAQGTADLALANIYLSVAGDRTRGTLTASARITGTRAAPRIEGSGKIANGFFRSAASGFELRDVAADFAGSERRVAVTSLSAKSANGGTISGQGEIVLDPANNYPITLSVKADNAQLVATELTTVIADVDARMSGGLLLDAQITGSADVSLWEIRLPERLARPLTPIRVTHRNAPPQVAATLPAEGSEEAQSSLTFGLDVTVRAPQRVHVRGQGMQAEFGGQVKVAGTVDRPTVNGRFDLRRGSVQVLTQRVNLTRGRVAFTGGLIPTLDIAGEVRKSDVTATVNVKGRANAPEISLTSTPTLPQDEIMARILFNKSTQQLSAFEAVQLAGAIARWSGLRSGPDILETLRSSLGIDALSATTDPEGGTALSAGGYLGSGVYLGFVQGTDTRAGRATVDYDLTDTVKLRGEAGPSGDTRVGVVAEWEY